VTSSMG